LSVLTLRTQSGVRGKSETWAGPEKDLAGTLFVSKRLAGEFAHISLACAWSRPDSWSRAGDCPL